MRKKKQETFSGKSQKEILELVAGDPDRVPYEKETVLLFNREEDYIHVHSFDPTIVKDLIRHRHFVVDRYVTNDSGAIIGTVGSLPTGVLKIKKKPRKQDYPSTIVATNGDQG